MVPASVYQPFKPLTLACCLTLAVLGAILPFVGWLFLVAALHLLVSEFEDGRSLVRSVRRHWPFLSRQIARARDHRWASGRLRRFDELTDPAK